MGGSRPGGTQLLPGLARGTGQVRAPKHSVIREANKVVVAKAMDVNPQPTVVLLVCSRNAASSRRLANKAERGTGHGHRKAVTALTSWLGRKRYKYTVTGRLALGTGDDAVPFIPFGSRPGGLAPNDPHVLGVGAQNLLKAPGTDVWFGGQPGPACTRPSKTWPAGDRMGWQEGAFQLAPVPHVLVCSPDLGLLDKRLNSRVPPRALLCWEARSAVVGS